MSTAGTPSSLLQTRGLTKWFGGLAAVQEVDLDVTAGHIHAVIGPNGAGKSTLFGLISGAIRPSDGSVRFRDREIVGLPPHLVARLGIVRKVQQTHVFESLSARDNVALGVLMRYRSRPSAGRIPRTRKLTDEAGTILEEIYLADRAEVAAGSLSHGERQRLETGMVLGTGAELLLLDEPTSGLSVEERDAMGELILRIAERATVLITEHDFDFIRHVADRVMVMNEGRKLLEGDVQEVAINQQVRELYLGEEQEEGGTPRNHAEG